MSKVGLVDALPIRDVDARRGITVTDAVEPVLDLVSVLVRVELGDVCDCVWCAIFVEKTSNYVGGSVAGWHGDAAFL